MTATRWWVRLAARWLARVEAVSDIVRMAMLTLTGLSTATLTLRQYGHGEYAWPLITAVGVSGVLFTWFYTEGGVYNQKNRDRVDLGDNYSGPTMLLDRQITGAQFAELAHVLQNGEQVPIDELEERMRDATIREWASLRDGVDIEELEELEESR